MIPVRVIVGTIWVAILLGVRGIWTVPAPPLEGNPGATTTISQDSVPGRGDSGLTTWDPGLLGDENGILSGGADDFAEAQMGDDRQPLADEGQLFDVYGNEIEAASEDYRIDPRGEIYERHSPDTALPRLAAAGV